MYVKCFAQCPAHITQKVGVEDDEEDGYEDGHKMT